MDTKTAIVTGGTRGIGEAITKRLAQSGINVVIWGTKSETAQAAAEKVAQEHKVKSLGMGVDIAKVEQVNAAVEQTVEQFGAVDILVNNAGITRDGLMVAMSDDDWNAVIDTNLKGLFYCARAVAKIMAKQRRGVIINITSVVGIMGNAGQANYSAAKGGVIALTKTIAREFSKRHIRCNAVAPGFIETAMTDKLSDKIKEQMKPLIPLGEFGKPEDVANVVNFLVSDEARYITGEIIKVDGGMAM